MFLEDELGDIIQKGREGKSWSQDDLAQATGIKIKEILKIENYELFPEKINVTFAQIKDSSNILVNVWERGAGLTKACGTAACATGVVAFEKKLSGKNTNIHFKEGLLNIKYNSVISMTGPVSDIKEIQIKL